MTQHGKGGVKFSSGGTASVVATDTRLSLLELSVANLEEKVKTLEMTVNDIRWGQKEDAEQEGSHYAIEEEKT